MEFPSDFIRLLEQLLGTLEASRLLGQLQAEPSISIQLNPAKCGSMSGRLPFAAVPWYSFGKYLDRRLTFTFDPWFHAGLYYVQEASSMFLHHVLKQYVSSPSLMLDLCAAPGGKSCVAVSSLPPHSLLVANEVMKNRVQVLAENLTKWGSAHTLVTNNDPKSFGRLPQLFDVVLADVPCSGEGMFRKDEGAVGDWSRDNVELCRQRQQRIVADVWPSLKPGGLFVYSTCTFNTFENEENVAWIARELGAQVLPVEVPSDWQITGNLAGSDFPVYRFFPHRVQGEGLFMAVLRKDDTSQTLPENASGLKSKSDKYKSSLRLSDSLLRQGLSGLLHPEAYRPDAQGEVLRVIPAEHFDTVQRLRASLHVLLAGVTVGVVKGKDLIPHPSLALSAELNRSQFSRAELSYEQAIAYLRKEAVTLSDEAPSGYVLLTYQGFPLGFAKNIGNRANNLYPPEWRIRSGYLPDEIRTLSSLIVNE